MDWKTAVQKLIAAEVGIRSGFCSVNNTEYRSGPDQPHSQHAGEIQWDYRKQTYLVLNVYTDQELSNLQTDTAVEHAFELLGVTNSDWE